MVPAAASAATTASADAQAVIVSRLSLVNTAPLDFGAIIAGSSNGTVTVGSDGSVSSTGGAIPVGGGTSTAHFYGYGTRNEIVSLRLAQNQINITRAGGGQMLVNNFTINSTPPTTLSAGQRYFRLNEPDGFYQFDVGATLHVGANQPLGTYRGTFQVTVQYY